MSINENKKCLVLLLASVGLITLPHIQHTPGPIIIYFSLMLCWRFIGIWHTQLLPHRIVIFLLTLGSFFLLYSQHQTVLGRDAGTSLFITAMGLKLLEIRSKKDVYIVTFLAFIIAAAEFLFLQNILMAVYTLSISCILLATMVCINSLEPVILPTFKSAAGIILQAIPLMLVMFIFFPRLSAPRWMIFADSGSALTGLSDSLEPGSISQLGMSDELVFRVRFADQVPAQKLRYWRGPVMSKTDGRRWFRGKLSTQTGATDAISHQGKAYHYTLMMEPQKNNWVFALDMPAKFPATLTMNADLQLLRASDAQQRAEYRVTSYPQYNTGRLSAADFNDMIQLPKPASTRIKTLVAKLRGFDGTPEVYIEQLLKYFREQNFYYTLHPPLLHEKPIESFLFDTRRGFCSHYATAFVYLLRVAKIPARVVTGYQGGSVNKLGNFLEIRQANAHAWAEVWLQQRGWTRIDPTAAVAPERIEQDVNIDLQIASGEVNFSSFIPAAGSFSTWLKQSRYLWNSIDYNWQRWIINYNNNLQSRFLSSLGITSLTHAVYLLALCVAFITLLIYLLMFYSRKPPTDQALLWYKKFCAKLAAAGIKIRTGEGARDFAQRSSRSIPGAQEQITRITDLYIRLRYSKAFEAEDFTHLKNRVRLFRLKS